ncbi:MAG: hypothetical protein R3C59_23045 [Planctomycetaceae bacterium]
MSLLNLQFCAPRTSPDANLRLHSFTGRLAFVFCLGLFCAVWADVGNMIWWRHPPLWTAFHFAYDTLSWLLAGVIIAAIIKTGQPAETSESQ